MYMNVSSIWKKMANHTHIHTRGDGIEQLVSPRFSNRLRLSDLIHTHTHT